ncbi:hypothetical protein K431DRAFT_350502 [Polychaeton citri CBS 116435]|uniref:Uncharacterized protein n=1 Tax=Polychaeton citri CBS 116435 TaxID=1314669 RepID=A0A9P4PYJ9_9PEZI|nr:hypothetical protein K431DRAFT_350502 [Polychaeton citri CBS 116435]
MPHTHGVPNMSGRNSRASDISHATVGSRLAQQAVPHTVGVQPGDTVSNAGVMSMLKTSTDTSDIGALSFNKSRLPIMPRPTAQPRRGHKNRHSASSNYPTNSTSINYAPSASTSRRGSLNSMQSTIPYVADTQDPTQIDITRFAPYDMPETYQCPGGRSYSLTTYRSERHLSHYRSQASVKSQGHEPMRNLAPPVSLMSDHRHTNDASGSRVGYRPPSPALSDFSQGHPMPTPQIHPRGGHPMPRPPPRSYYSDHGSEYMQEIKSLQQRLPLRGVSNSPVYFHDESQRHHPSSWRLGGPTIATRSHGQHPAYRNVHTSAGTNGQYAQSGSSQRVVCHQMHGQGSRRHPPPVNPYPRQGGGSSASQYAGRYIPRSTTPRSDYGPPSSDPPSSETMQSSSSLSTPNEGTPIRVTINSDSDNPELPESTSEPVLPAHYFEYAEGFLKGVDEMEADCHTASIPPFGFVQRVRAVLESRAAADRAAKREAGYLDQHVGMPASEPVPDPAHQNTKLHHDIHELATETSPRTTVLDGQVPVELPASPINRVTEADVPQNEASRPLTRALVRAILSPTPSKDDEDENEDDECISQRTHPISSRVKADTGVQSEQATEEVDSMVFHRDGNKSVHVRDSCTDMSSKHTSITGSTRRLSGNNYALRFSVPVDTATLDETHSNDPFALDADTITAQNQNSKQSQIEAIPQAGLQFREPVSPIQGGEDVTRFSDVSPLHVRMAGVETSLRLRDPSRKQSDGHDTDDTGQRSIPGTFPEELQSFSVSRAPRSLSKSLQVTLQANSSTCETGSRYSLPSGLGKVCDTTTDSFLGSGDLARRFSIPARPASEKDSPISMEDPIDEGLEPQQEKQIGRDERHKPRGWSIITFEDDITPLEAVKTESLAEENSEANGSQQGQIKSNISKAHCTERQRKPVESSPVSAGVGNTAGLRISGIAFIRKHAGTHSPRSKEEPQSNNPIAATQSSKYQQPHPTLPARIAAVKAMHERRKHEAESGTANGQDVRRRSRILSEARDLPSLNFSCMDLFDKLNDALEVRSSDSIDVIRRRDFSGICCTSNQHLASANTLRDRYMSFFKKPGMLDLKVALTNDFIGDEGHTIRAKLSESESKADEQHGKEERESVDQQDDNDDDGIITNTVASPSQDFMSVASQISRLSIPSVSALTDRLSDILSGKTHLDSHLLTTEQDVRNAIEDIRQIGEGGRRPRPQTMLSSRTSAGFRTLAERAEEFVRNGHHESLVAKGGTGVNKDLPPLPQARFSSQCLSPLASSKDRAGVLPSSASAPSDLGVLPIRPQSALTCSRSPETVEEVRNLLPCGDNPLSRRKKRSLVVSSPNSRPWNLDESYPWATTNVAIHLTAPKPTYQRNSVLNEAMRERGTRSLDMTNFSSGYPTITVGNITGQTTTTGIDIGSLDTSFTSNVFTDTEQCTGLPKYERKHGTQTIIGTLTKKMGLSRNEIGGTTKSRPASLTGLCGRPHDPGERYPSTGLTPPTALNLDEVRSFFSDDSSETERRYVGRKRRLTSISKIRSSRKRLSTSHTKSLDGLQSTTYDVGSMNECSGSAIASTAANLLDATGMGKTEFTFKRFGEKLRSL